MAEEVDDDEPLPEDLAESCGEFLSAWAAIQSHRVAGWLLLTGRRRARLSEAFFEALQVLDGFDPPAVPYAAAERGAFWTGFYHRKAGVTDAPQA